MLQRVLLQNVKSISDKVHYHFNLMLQRVLFAKCEAHGVHLGRSTLSFQLNASKSTFAKSEVHGVNLGWSPLSFQLNASKSTFCKM